jgi:hypothetical protein
MSNHRATRPPTSTERRGEPRGRRTVTMTSGYKGNMEHTRPLMCNGGSHARKHQGCLIVALSWLTSGSRCRARLRLSGASALEADNDLLIVAGAILVLSFAVLALRFALPETLRPTSAVTDLSS